ncbi:hypothetical protein GF325_05600 [Candidatus Bathyarchaeota archaeon]|nr:hypothetical protein [Candidatus Bathyarchaeota archaeon]
MSHTVTVQSLVKTVRVSCPTCKEHQVIQCEQSLLEKTQSIAVILVEGECGHKFHVFVDSNFKVRGYQATDAVICGEIISRDFQDEMFGSENQDDGRNQAICEQGTFTLEAIERQYRERRKRIEDMIFAIEVQHLEFKMSDEELETRKGRLNAILEKLDNEYNAFLESI